MLIHVYLHSPEHPDVPAFYRPTLCSSPLVACLTEHFVVWGGGIRIKEREEGFKMSNSLKASHFPFCAIVVASYNQRISLLHQIEGPKAPEEMHTLLQRVVEERAPSLIAARLEAEERRNNHGLREEQDAVYRAALEVDQAWKHQLKEEEERLKREAERKHKEEEVALARAACEVAEKEAALVRRRQEEARSLGAEPDKGPHITQVLDRFPTGERRERRFHSSAMISSLYDYLDSSRCLEAENYAVKISELLLEAKNTRIKDFMNLVS